MGYFDATGAASNLCRFFRGDTRPGYVKIAMERSTMLLMGKSTISMAIFNSFLYVYQRVFHVQIVSW
jgi:hypothetical protein